MIHTTANSVVAPIAKRSTLFFCALILSLAANSASAGTLKWGAITNFADSARLYAQMSIFNLLSIDVREWATTADGEWVVVPASGPIVYSQNFPHHRALIDLFHSLGRIDAIAFTSNGDPAIVAGPFTYLPPGIPSRNELFSKIHELRSVAGRIDELAFTPDGQGWIVTADSLGFSSNIPEDLNAAIEDVLWSDRFVSNVAIGADGRWALVADQWYASSDLSGSLRGDLQDFLRQSEELSRLLIGPGNGYLLYSHQGFEPAREIEELEMNFGGENIYQRMDDLNIAGLSIALIQDNQVHQARGYGILDAGEPEQWVRTDSPFALASLSKYLTSLTAMTLVDDGLLNLDSDLYELATENPGSDLHGWRQHHETVVGRVSAGLTLSRLLSHTAGVADSDLNRFNLDTWTSRDLSTLDLLSGSTGGGYVPDRVSLIYAPGFNFLVSNPSFLLAEAMTQHITGEDFAELLQERLFDPLGMASGSIADPDRQDWNEWTQQAAVWHDASGAPYFDRRDIIADRAAGGIYASAADYARAMISCAAAWTKTGLG